jgi:hypothetical protein
MLAKLKTEFREQVWNNEQVLKLRQKFAELDTQTQSYILIGSFAGFVLVLLLTFFTLWGKTISLKNELARMDESIRMTQNSSVRIEELKAQARSRGSDPMLAGFDGSGDASSFADRVIQKSLIAKTSTEVKTVTGGASVALNKISLRQLVRALYLIEKSNSGASIERLGVSSKDDPEGFLWAEILLKKGDN